MNRPKSGNAKVVVVVLAVVAGGMCVCGGILAALLIPAMTTARIAAQSAMSRNNMKQIGLALDNYHDVYGAFPLAVMTNENGVEHSWRVAILPFLEYGVNHDQYDFDQPWDSATNLRVAEMMPLAYQNQQIDPNIFPNSTSYVAIAAPDTMISTTTHVEASMVADPSNVIMVVDAPQSPVPWTKPEDMTPEDFAAIPPFDQMPNKTINALFGDGSVLTISESERPEVGGMLSITHQ